MKVKLAYFNNKYNLYIYADSNGSSDWDKAHEAKIRKVLNGHIGEFRLTTHLFAGLEFFTYGLMYEDTELRPRHGGEWSSNPGAIHEVFNVKLIDVALNNVAIAMTHDDIMKLINPEVYRIDTNGMFYSIQANIVEPVIMYWYDENGNPIKK